MKRFFIRTSKVLLFAVCLLFLSAFIWANWDEPSPGMKAPVVDFIQYDLTDLSPEKIHKLQTMLRSTPGIKGLTFNESSEILVISYLVSETSRERIESRVLSDSSYKLREKVFIKSGPKCPIDVAWISRVKKTLCVRD